MLSYLGKKKEKKRKKERKETENKILSVKESNR